MIRAGVRLRAGAVGWLFAGGGRRLTALVLAGAVLVVLLVTLPSTGITDDDDFYAPAGIAYAAHSGRVLSLQAGALQQADVDRTFSQNREHPPFAKWVMGVCYHLLHQWTGWMRALDAARVGVVLLAAALAYLLASFAFAWRGPVAAVVAVVALFSFPRFFFHAHVATLDVPVATMYFATAYAYWRSRRSLGWSLGVGVVFGLALLTKLNAPFALAPILVFALVERWRGFRRAAPGHFAVPAIPFGLLAMLVVGPILFVALWPYLWFETFKRIGEYLAFHLNHYPIYMYYFGRIYEKPFAPWHTPFVMFAITTPITLLGAVAAGLIGLPGRRLLAFVRGERDAEAEEGGRVLYVLLHLVTTIGVVAFLGSPKYGGVKLFLPFFPFAALLVGLGVDTAARGALRLWPRLTARPDLVLVALGALVLAPAAAVAIASHPFGLSYYGAAVGGLRGATAIGFERQYYDVADKELAAWLSANAPRGATVHFEPNNKEYVKTYRWLARDGYLRRDLRVVGDSKADYLVLTHERRWATYPDLAARHARRTPVYEKRIDGVPLYSVYAAR